MTAPAAEVRLTISDIDVDALTMHLRGLVPTDVALSVNYTPPQVDAALRRLVRALEGDLFKAVAYLEDLAERNKSLARWIASQLSDELVAIDVIRRVGLHPAVEWPDMPGRYAHFVDALTFDELIDSALVGTVYDRILTANRAQDLGLVHRLVYCELHERVLTFKEFCFVHLSNSRLPEIDAETTVPAPRGQERANTGTHSRSNVRAATEADVTTWQQTAATNRGIPFA